MIDPLNELRRLIQDLERGLRQLRSDRVNRRSIIEAGRRIVDYYFRSVRESLLRTGISIENVTACDAMMQGLLEITHRSSTVSAYRKLVRGLNAQLLA